MQATPAVSPAPAVNDVPVVQPQPRVVAVDAYRGFVMFLMMAEVLRLSKVAQAFPGNPVWQFLAFNQSHVEWTGCSLHDMIQPSFSFLVGVALPFSLGNRLARGANRTELFLHAVWRAFLLAALGIFLRSTHSPQTNFTFEDTLTQIGLGYPFLFLLGMASARIQAAALGIVLFGYWLAWALYPVPGPNFDWAAVRVPADWAHHLNGFAAHWDKNSNLGAAFDQWFLNLFPRPKAFVANGGGYLTLSFVPTLGTMILGLLAGQWLRAARPGIPFRKLLVAGAAGVALGAVLHFAGICPIVKRIWTPSWTLFSGGICFLFLAAFLYMIDARGWKKWSLPLVVIGSNSIAAYLMAHLFEQFVIDSFRIHLGANVFAFAGAGLAPLWQGMAVLAVFWLMLYWMFRRKIFLKI